MENVIYTLKQLYNYMEDRADENNGGNNEYHFLFKIHKALQELGAGDPEDDKFGIAGKEQPRRLSAFSADDVADFLGSVTNSRNDMDDSDSSELNESVSRIKNIMKIIK